MLKVKGSWNTRERDREKLSSVVLEGEGDSDIVKSQSWATAAFVNIAEIKVTELQELRMGAQTITNELP